MPKILRLPNFSLQILLVSSSDYRRMVITFLRNGGGVFLSQFQFPFSNQIFGAALQKFLKCKFHEIWTKMSEIHPSFHTNQWKVHICCRNCEQTPDLTTTRKFGPKMTDFRPKFDPQNYGNHGNGAIYVIVLWNRST